MPEDALLHDHLLHTSRAAAHLIGHIRAQGVPVRVALHPDHVALYLHDDDACDMDYSHPTWNALRTANITVYSEDTP